MRRSPRWFRALLTAALAVPALVAVAGAAITPVYVLEWGTPGAANGQFAGPSGVAVDPANSNVFVTDTGNNRIQVFDSSGNFLFAWGTAGAGPGQFAAPFGIAIDRGAVYVVDTNNRRVQKFTMAGVFVTQWGTQGNGPGQFQQPMCITIDGINGDAYVTD